jgi:hypothetical protein
MLVCVSGCCIDLKMFENMHSPNARRIMYFFTFFLSLGLFFCENRKKIGMKEQTKERQNIGISI